MSDGSLLIPLVLSNTLIAFKVSQYGNMGHLAILLRYFCFRPPGRTCFIAFPSPGALLSRLFYQSLIINDLGRAGS